MATEFKHPRPFPFEVQSKTTAEINTAFGGYNYGIRGLSLEEARALFWNLRYATLGFSVIGMELSGWPNGGAYGTFNWEPPDLNFTAADPKLRISPSISTLSQAVVSGGLPLVVSDQKYQNITTSWQARVPSTGLYFNTDDQTYAILPNIRWTYTLSFVADVIGPTLYPETITYEFTTAPDFTTDEDLYTTLSLLGHDVNVFGLWLENNTQIQPGAPAVFRPTIVSSTEASY